MTTGSISTRSRPGAPWHLWAAVTGLAAAAAGTVILVITLAVHLVVAPFLTGAGEAPGDFIHWYKGYNQSVSQQFEQARQQDGAAP